MRLLLVTTDFPPDTGGTQTYAVELARRLAAACDDFAVVAPALTDDAAIDRELPYEVFRVNATAGSMWLRSIPTLLDLSRKRGFDSTFHVQWTSAPAGLAARSRAAISQVFIAAHGRELLLNKLQTTATRGIYDAIRKRVISRADKLFPVSRYTGEILSSIGLNGAELAVVPNGVDVDRFAPSPEDVLRRRLGLDGCRVLLTVCRLVERKGVDSVIRSLPYVLERVPNAVYLVCGDGPDKIRLEGLARDFGVSEHVRLLGRVPDVDLADYYNACDVFTMPARSEPPDVEGFGLVFLEAAACGKPAVALNDGGVPDAIVDGATGLLVERDDLDGLRTSLANLLGNPPLAIEMGRRARERVLAEATWDVTASRLYDAMTA